MADDQIKGMATKDAPAKEEPAAKPADDEAKPTKAEVKASDDAAKAAREAYLRAWPLEADEKR